MHATGHDTGNPRLHCAYGNIPCENSGMGNKHLLSCQKEERFQNEITYLLSLFCVYCSRCFPFSLDCYNLAGCGDRTHDGTSRRDKYLRKSLEEFTRRDWLQGLVPRTVHTKGFERLVRGLVPSKMARKGLVPVTCYRDYFWPSSVLTLKELRHGSCILKSLA